MITVYHYTDFNTMDDYEDFLNKLYIGLEYYKKRNPKFVFKLTYTGDEIILKTLLRPKYELN
jgi:hypothetical protein